MANYNYFQKAADWSAAFFYVLIGRGSNSKPLKKSIFISQKLYTAANKKRCKKEIVL